METPPTAAQVLPCPLAAGWELLRTIPLPRTGSDGQPMGGFSAAAYVQNEDRLWLLSDAPRGHLVPFSGLRAQMTGRGALRAGPRLLLRDGAGELLPEGFDGEGLVLAGDGAWIVSEGRRTPERRARLQRHSLRNGRLLEERSLPAAWQERPGQGLKANKGPESLTRTPAGDLVLAAEAPLLQDSAVDAQDLVPLAVQVSGEPPRPLGRIALGPAGAAASRSLGLTELLALDAPPALLALLRSYSPPQRWTAQLQLLPLPASPREKEPPLVPARGWDLLDAGLPADNWEGMAWGPQLDDGRVVLVLVSDDNFNPLQRSWVSLLVPRRGSGCPSGRFQF